MTIGNVAAAKPMRSAHQHRCRPVAHTAVTSAQAMHTQPIAHIDITCASGRSPISVAVDGSKTICPA